MVLNNCSISPTAAGSFTVIATSRRKSKLSAARPRSYNGDFVVY